ncbi:MAG: hypothetical protein AAFX06_15730 [Planctomycetota bacterium]
MSNEPPATPRRTSIDVYRGMIMFLMLAEIMHLFELAEDFPGVGWLQWLRFHTTHVEWTGCSLHDLIQPGFTFLVGVAMPFSIASRLKREHSRIGLLVHAAWRAFALCALGIVLRSLDSDRTYFTFEDTLTQIGLGYFFVFLLALGPRWGQYVSAFGILLLFWAAFALSDPPPPDFDYAAVGVPEDWEHHAEGFESRWNMNSNLSWKTDVWFLNLFPREEPFEFNWGGYCTLSFVPTAVTMLFGLIVGGWLRDIEAPRALLRNLLIASIFGLASGWGLAEAGLCPLVKKIWTPSFTLFSGGCCTAWLLILVILCDVKRWTRWAFPFVVIGANSILIYVMSWTIAEPIRELLLRHFGQTPFAMFGDAFVKPLTGVVTLVILFYMLLWLFRRRAFVKI